MNVYIALIVCIDYVGVQASLTFNRCQGSHELAVVDLNRQVIIDIRLFKVVRNR